MRVVGLSVGVSASAPLLGSVAVEKISASWVRAKRWLSLRGDSADAGDGFRSALMRSLAAAMAVSVEDAVGITTFDGNHVSVSLILSACVVFIQTRKHR